MRTQELLIYFGISTLIVRCALADPGKISVGIIAQASDGQHITMAYSHEQDKVLTVVTRPDYLRSKYDFEFADSRDMSGRLTLVTPEGKTDITQSGNWYDIREDGLHKYQLGNISTGALTNFVNATDDLKNLNYSNFVAWQHGKH